MGSEKKEIAQKIVEGLGGAENIVTFENCMTRLRVVVKDGGKVNREALTKEKEIMRVVGSDTEPQIILGPGVAESIGQVIKRMDGINYSETHGEAVMTKKSAKGIFSFFSQVFTPLIPVFAGAGLMFGVVKILTVIYNIGGVEIFNPDASQFMLVMNVLASTFFTYLNIAVAMSAAKVMGGNPYLGLIAGGIITNLGGLAGMEVGILGLVFTNGRGGTLAALAAGALIAVVEREVKKRVPDALKIHLPSLLSIIIVGLATIYVIQPVAGVITDVITNAFLWLLDNAGFMAYAIIAGFFLPLVMMGMHHGLSPIHTTFIETLGSTPLYACCSMAGGGQVGASLALYVKYRGKTSLKAAIMGGLPAGILGIGEPLIYGVTLPLGRAFITACLGAACGGAVLGFFPGQGAVTMNVSGILGALVNVRPGAYLLAYAVSIAAGFVITYAVGVKESAMETFGE